MAKNKVDITGINTSKLKTLTNEEQLELFEKFHQGDLEAREELINGNLKLVLSILKKFINRVDNLDDLFQIGCIGLVKAIDNFDLKHEVKFSTYGVPMILGEIKRYLRDNCSVRISRSVKDIAYKSIKAKEYLSQILNKEPTTLEIAAYLDIDELEINHALTALKEPVSMFEPIYNDGGDTIYLFDQLEDKSSNENMNLNLSLDEAMNKLKPREQLILNDRFIYGKTQMELANELGISQAQISRLEQGAIKSLKKIIK